MADRSADDYNREDAALFWLVVFLIVLGGVALTVWLT